MLSRRQFNFRVTTMKLLFKLLLIITTAQITIALFGSRKIGNKFVRNKSFNLEPPISKNSKFETVETKWIEQKLDNFDPQDERTWQMRYMENNFFLQDGGPIFIFVGGEIEIVEGWLLGGHMHDMTRDLNGTMYYVEHRYYGRSRPTPDLTSQNLRYLSADQALADLAHFIVHVKESNLSLRHSGVILVGASYSAALVTWFMQKYPHLANGAWSSSAPINAQLDFVEYKEVVSDALELLGGTNCTDRIRNAFKMLEQLVEDGNSNRIEEVFRLCYPLDLSNNLDVWNFFADISVPFSYAVQTHREANQDIQNECKVLVDSELTDDLEALAYWWWSTDISPESPTYNCYDHRYSTYIRYFNGTGWDDASAWYAVRQWTYQTCSGKAINSIN